MPTDLQSLGIGGILVIMVLREVFGFLKPMIEARRGKANGHAPKEVSALGISPTFMQETLKHMVEKQDKAVELLTEIKAVLQERR